MQVLILAGGLATRLRTLTKNIPKALLPINKKPFIHYQLNYLRSQGVTNVVLCLSYLSNQITNYVGDGSKYGLNIRYSFDGNTLLGTGGAIKNAYSLLDDFFFIMYGDSFLPISFKDLYKEFRIKKSKALMAIYKNKNLLDQSNIIYDGKKITLYDKDNFCASMKFIDYGISLVSKSIFKKIKSERFDLSSVYNKLSTEGLLDSYVTYKRFYEIGSFSGIDDFKKYVKKKGL